MKERPILFQPEMIRAERADQKTMTRRPLKNPEHFGCPTGDCPHWNKNDCNKSMNSPEILAECPYGVVGDHLYVRETWQYVGDLGRPTEVPEGKTYPQAAVELLEQGIGCPIFLADVDDCGQCPTTVMGGIHITPKDKWIPSIFMPRPLSRRVLEVTEVRLEKLLDITDGDAVAEGITHWAKSLPPAKFEQLHRKAGFWPAPSARQSYLVLWDLINAKRGYPASGNPWVWAISWRRVL